jgi:beta-lactamase regulating signal transducer with metallopeptidase domain
MQPVAQAAVEAIASSLILGLAIAAAAWILTRLLPPGKAGLRFAVWFIALAAIGLVPLLQHAVRARGLADGQAAAQGLIQLSPLWALYLFWIWAVIACLGLFRVLASACHLYRLGSAGTVVKLVDLPSSVRESVLRAAQARAFELRVSDQVRVPVAIGFLRPAVVVPTCLLVELTPDQLNQVLLHETAHLLRYDDWTNLFQKIAYALLFFSPAVWWLNNRLSLEREMACDEAVVAATSNPRAYAECLALLAKKSLLSRSLALVQAAVSRLRHTTLRVEALLAVRRTKRSWAAAAGVLGVLACSAVFLQAPDFISFQRTGTRTGSQFSVLGSQRQVPENLGGSRLGTESGKPRTVLAKLRTENREPRTGLGNREPRGGLAAKLRTETREPKTVLAKLRTENRELRTLHTQPPRLVVTTFVIVEDNGGAVASEQVWRIWRLTWFYPAAQRTATQISKKI